MANNMDLSSSIDSIANSSVSLDLSGYVTSTSSGNLASTYFTPSFYTRTDLAPEWEVNGISEKNLKNLIRSIPSESLSEIVEKAISLGEICSDSSDNSRLVKFIVSNRVCPEDFLLEYLDYLTPEIIMIHHSELLLEKKYQALFLKLKVK